MTQLCCVHRTLMSPGLISGGTYTFGIEKRKERRRQGEEKMCLALSSIPTDTASFSFFVLELCDLRTSDFETTSSWLRESTSQEPPVKAQFFKGQKPKVQCGELLSLPKEYSHQSGPLLTDMLTNDTAQSCELSFCWTMQVSRLLFLGADLTGASLQGAVLRRTEVQSSAGPSAFPAQRILPPMGPFAEGDDHDRRCAPCIGR